MKRLPLLLVLVGCVLEPNPSPGPGTGFVSDTSSYRPDTTGGGVQDAASGASDSAAAIDVAIPDAMAPADAMPGEDASEPGCLPRPVACEPAAWSTALAEGYFAWASTTPVVMTVAGGQCTSIDRTCQDACDCRWIQEGGCVFRAANRCQPHVQFDGPGDAQPGCAGLDSCDGAVVPEGRLDCVAGECVVVQVESDGTDLDVIDSDVIDTELDAIANDTVGADDAGIGTDGDGF